MSPPRRTFVVVGLGTFGQAVALELTRLGNTVLGIDIADDAVNDVADDLAQVVRADARSDDALREAGVDGYDVGVIAQASDLESSVMAAMNLKSLGVGTVWAKATSGTHREILLRLGVDRVIHPEREVGVDVAAELHNPLILDDMQIGDALVAVSISVPKAISGRSLEDLKLGSQKLRCLGVIRGKDLVGGEATPCTVAAGDVIVLLGEPEAVERFVDNL